MYHPTSNVVFNSVSASSFVLGDTTFKDSQITGSITISDSLTITNNLAVNNGYNS